jgi:hypothetical protein
MTLDAPAVTSHDQLADQVLRPDDGPEKTSLWQRKSELEPWGQAASPPSDTAVALVIAEEVGPGQALFRWSVSAVCSE